MLEKGKRVGGGRRGGSKGRRGGLLVSEASPPPRNRGWGWGRNPSGIGNNIGKMLVSDIALPPVVVINGDVRGPIVVEVKIGPADRNASTGVEKESGIRKRGSSGKSRRRDRYNKGRGLGGEVSEIGRSRISGKSNPGGTNDRRRVLRGSDAFDNLGDNIVERADVVLGRRDLDMISPRNWALGDLAHMDRRDNVDARIGLKSDPLPPK